jgi:plasmid stabilization system protein ParE
MLCVDKRYKLRYLPIFERDLDEVADYIARVLQNPIAALRLVEDTEKAILRRLNNPLIFAPYHSLIDRKQPYYTIQVRNYTVFYVVIDDVMEVRRFVYGKRNLPELV